MTSYIWLTLELDEKSDLKWVSTIWKKLTDQLCPCFEIDPSLQKPRFEPFFAYSGGILNLCIYFLKSFSQLSFEDMFRSDNRQKWWIAIRTLVIQNDSFLLFSPLSF